MPIYEYQCKACGHRLEELQGFNDKPLRKCPACQKPKLQKLVSAPSFQLKGTGWYVTDFKNPQKKPGGDTETTTEKKDKSETSNPPKQSDKVSGSKD